MRFLHLSDYGRCAFGGDPALNRITLSRVALSAKAQRSKLAGTDFKSHAGKRVELKRRVLS